MGPQVERQRRDNRGAEGCEEGGVGVPLPTGGEFWGGLCPLPRNFFISNFYIKIVSFRHTGQQLVTVQLTVLPKSEIRLELKFTGDRSSILGTRPIITRLRKISRQKMTKMHQKLLKEIARRLRCFFFAYISVFILLKFLRVVDWGHFKINF